MITESPDPLSRILRKADELRAATTRANAYLADIERKLNDANLGVEFWFDGRRLVSCDATGDLGPHSTSAYTAEVLGYGRVQGKFRLAVKRLRFVSGFFEGHIDSPFTNTYADGEPQSLLSTTRDTRF